MTGRGIAGVALFTLAILLLVGLVLVKCEMDRRAAEEKEIWNSAIASGRDPIKAVLEYRALKCLVQVSQNCPGWPTEEEIAAYRKCYQESFDFNRCDNALRRR
jgi:hypothetical protein